jgi:hypothetical protein
MPFHRLQASAPNDCREDHVIDRDSVSHANLLSGYDLPISASLDHLVTTLAEKVSGSGIPSAE